MAYQVNVKQLKSTSWYREGGAMAPFYIHIPYLGQFKNLNYGVFYSKKLVGDGYYDQRAMEKVAQYVFKKQIQNKNFIDKLIIKWKKARDDQDRFFNSLSKSNFKTLNNKELINLYQRFNKSRENLWNKTGFILEVFNEYDLPFLNKILSRYNQELTSDEIKILTTPDSLTFSFIAKRDFLKLYQKFKIKSKNFNKELDKYTQNYFWLYNNWAFIYYLDKKYWLKQLQTTNYQKLSHEIQESKNYLAKIKKRQKKIIKKHKLHFKALNFFYFLGRLGIWRDERKKQTLKENGWADKFLREFSERSKIKQSLLKYVSPYYFENKINISFELLRKLKTQEALMVGKDFKNWKIFYSTKAREVRNIIERTQLLMDKGVLEGRIANPGIARGVAKLVFTYKDFNKINKGDILVTQMTRPEFVPIFSKIQAIITDEGGLTCHAAIISRELGIPCLIGTKIATKVLKDGDKVEVDATKGVVRILKRER